MLLYNNGLLAVEYAPADDVMLVEMPDIQSNNLPQVWHFLQLIIKHVKAQGVTKLLLDSSKSVVEVGEEEYEAVSRQFAMDVMTTKLQKLARVASNDAHREAKVETVSSQVQQQVPRHIAYRNFTQREEALAWLLGNEDYNNLSTVPNILAFT